MHLADLLRVFLRAVGKWLALRLAWIFSLVAFPLWAHYGLHVDSAPWQRAEDHPMFLCDIWGFAIHRLTAGLGRCSIQVDLLLLIVAHVVASSAGRLRFGICFDVAFFCALQSAASSNSFKQ